RLNFRILHGLATLIENLARHNRLREQTHDKTCQSLSSPEIQRNPRIGWQLPTFQAGGPVARPAETEGYGSGIRIYREAALSIGLQFFRDISGGDNREATCTGRCWRNA